MRTLTLLCALLLAPVASAQDVGGVVQAEFGSIANRDPAYDLFNSGDSMPSYGLRGGLRLGDYVNLIGGWHRVRQGATVSVPTATGNGDVSRDQVTMAIFADTFTLGGRVGYPGRDLFVPYASVEGALMRCVMKLDEDSNTKRNPGQVLGSGLAPGLILLGGSELRTATLDDWGFSLGVFFELGYSWFLSGDFGDIGQMRPGGFTGRVGTGVRF